MALMFKTPQAGTVVAPKWLFDNHLPEVRAHLDLKLKIARSNQNKNMTRRYRIAHGLNDQELSALMHVVCGNKTFGSEQKILLKNWLLANSQSLEIDPCQ